MIKFALLGFGISSPDERRENFRKWERYRQQREVEQKWYGGKSLDEQVREEHERLTRDAAVRKGGGSATKEKADGSDGA